MLHCFLGNFSPYILKSNDNNDIYSPTLCQAHVLSSYSMPFAQLTSTIIIYVPIQLLANMSEGVDNVMDITFDWITRTLYFATSNATQILMIWGLPLDNPLLEPVCTVDVILNDSKIFMTVSPFTGYASGLCTVALI